MMAESEGLQGVRIRQYTFMKKLGEGSWAIVYLVYDEQSRRFIACKVILSSKLRQFPKLRELTNSEITILKGCRSSNVVAFVDSFEMNGDVFILMEYCNEGTMGSYLTRQKEGRIPEKQAVGFLRQILNGFQGLRQVGCLHRDFKSDNVLLHNGVAKVADLGFSKILPHFQSKTTTMLGTSSTMAPEILKGDPYGFECDIWSIGIVYYEWLTGKYPYSAKNDIDRLKKMNQPPSFPPFVSADSKDFILKCLKVKPQERIRWRDIFDHKLISNISAINREANYGELVLPNQPYNCYDAGQCPQLNQMQTLQNQNLQRSSNMAQLQREFEQMSLYEDKIHEYTCYYLQRRNFLLLPLTYGVVPVVELMTLKNINHFPMAFFIYKEAYLEMSRLARSIQNYENIFRIKQYWEAFVKSQDYLHLYERILTEIETIRKNAESLQQLVRKTVVDPTIAQDLDLEYVSPNFQSSLKRLGEEYATSLFRERNDPTINKRTLLRLIAFISNKTNNKVQGTSQQYSSVLESYNLEIFEQQLIQYFGQQY